MKIKNKTTVLAFGTFDLLHPGHIAYLTYAKEQGNRLVVIIARTISVKKAKGIEPLFSEKDRQYMVSALRVVDKAILGDTVDHYKSIERVRPDIICLGYDHRIIANDIRKELKKRNIYVDKIVRTKKYNEKKYKSSLLKKKIQTLM